MRDPKEFRERFLRWKNGENYWDLRGIDLNNKSQEEQTEEQLTPELFAALELLLEHYTTGKDAVDDIPPAEDDKPNLFQDSDGRYFYQEHPSVDEITVTPTAVSQSMFEDPRYWDYIDADGRRYTPREHPQKQDLLTEGEKYTPFLSEVKKYFRELKYRAENDPSSILLQGKYVLPAILAPATSAFASPYVASALANPYVDAGIISASASHGLNHAVNEGIDGWGDAAMTALELVPLGRLAKPLYEGVVQPGMQLFNSPLTRKRAIFAQNAKKWRK